VDIPRSFEIKEINQHLKVTLAVGIVGPRQCGKTTLANQFTATRKGNVHYFDLEDPGDLRRLENPMLTLEDL
jgi:uncharacterized protein